MWGSPFKKSRMLHVNTKGTISQRKVHVTVIFECSLFNYFKGSYQNLVPNKILVHVHHVHVNGENYPYDCFVVSSFSNRD